MPVRLLGPVELAEAGDRPVRLGGAKRRSVLAALALEFGRPVPLARIFAMLWDTDPPPQAKSVVHGHIGALRGLLPGIGLRIETRSSGYVLEGDADAVDYARFRRLVATAHDSSGPESRRLLREALDLWRGSALAGLCATLPQRTLAERIEHERLEALRAWAEAQLAVGESRVAIPELASAARSYPLDEVLAALLIRCLIQAGRVAEARSAYHRVREQLADELGLDPGPILREAALGLAGQAGGENAGRADVSRVHRRAEPVPDLLPAAVDGFTGRAAETARLDQLAGLAHEAAPILVVTGPAGVGKSATALEWAHAAADRYPDGRLFANLRGFDADGPAEPAGVLADFLSVLGISEARMPGSLEERARLLRETIRERRVLVVLDNAADAEAVRPFVPDGAGCAALVTSRNQLEELSVLDGAHRLVLGPLPEPDALSLLEKTVGAARMADLAAARAVIAFCDGLPLTLRLCAARLATHPAWSLADLAAEMADEGTRLAVLEGAGRRYLHTALSLTRRHLAPDAERLLPLLALHPGIEVDAWSAGVLLDLEPPIARRALDNLAAYNVLEETAPGRYGRHDLVRAYCAGLLERELAPPAREAVAGRLIREYCTATEAARRDIQRPSGFQDHAAHARRPYRTSAQARAWLHNELPTLHALTREAIRHGLDEIGWKTANVVARFYYYSGRLLEMDQVVTIGLRGAERSGSPEGLVKLANGRSLALHGLGRADEALQISRDTVKLADGSGDFALRCLAATTLAYCLMEAGNPAEAIRVLADLPQDAAASEDGLDTGRVLSQLAAAWLQAGDAARAFDHARRALEAAAELPFSDVTLAAWQQQALALAELGRTEEAHGIAAHALELCRREGISHFETEFCGVLGSILALRGRDEEARAYLATAYARLEQRADGAARARKLAREVDRMLGRRARSRSSAL
jgi:DNA-binding SARP family transcriptional activator